MAERKRPYSRLTMIELVLSACLIAMPATCKDVHLSFVAENVTAMQCMLNGQPHMAQWVEANPKWRITRFRCEPVREAKITI